MYSKIFLLVIFLLFSCTSCSRFWVKEAEAIIENEVIGPAESAQNLKDLSAPQTKPCVVLPVKKF